MASTSWNFDAAPANPAPDAAIANRVRFFKQFAEFKAAYEAGCPEHPPPTLDQFRECLEMEKSGNIFFGSPDPPAPAPVVQPNLELIAEMARMKEEMAKMKRDFEGADADDEAPEKPAGRKQSRPRKKTRRAAAPIRVLSVATELLTPAQLTVRKALQVSFHVHTCTYMR